MVRFNCARVSAPLVDVQKKVECLFLYIVLQSGYPLPICHFTANRILATSDSYMGTEPDGEAKGPVTHKVHSCFRLVIDSMQRTDSISNSKVSVMPPA